MSHLISKHFDFSADLNLVAEKLEQYLGSENDRFLREITDELNKQPGLLSRIFPSAVQKEDKRLTVEKMRMIFHKRELFFEFYSNVKLEIAKRLADALVIPIGMDLQTRLAGFANEKIEEISETIASGRRKFLHNMKSQFMELEEYRDIPVLYEHAHESMKTEVEIYFKTIKKILEGFIENLERKVSEIN
ncbi:MAG: hypothetical protein AB7S75_02270 [Desulfococcaceae bacterium]